jgi:hypothetical protein
MYTIRLLPLSAPVAAGLSITAHGAAVVLALPGLFMLVLALALTIRAIRLRGSRHGTDPAGGRCR